MKIKVKYLLDTLSQFHLLSKDGKPVTNAMLLGRPATPAEGDSLLMATPRLLNPITWEFVGYENRIRNIDGEPRVLLRIQPAYVPNRNWDFSICDNVFRENPTMAGTATLHVYYLESETPVMPVIRARPNRIFTDTMLAQIRERQRLQDLLPNQGRYSRTLQEAAWTWVSDNLSSVTSWTVPSYDGRTYTINFRGN